VLQTTLLRNTCFKDDAEAFCNLYSTKSLPPTYW
jgi:hypothetical protein